MITTSMHTSDIPRIYDDFCSIIGEQTWKTRASLINQEIKGNKFLHDHLTAENSLTLTLERLRTIKEENGLIPKWVSYDQSFYPAAVFASQVLSFINSTPSRIGDQFKRRVQGAFKNPDDMRGIDLELTVATHFLQKKFTVEWPEISGIDTFDLLIPQIGQHGLEVECKSISGEKGRKIHTRESLDFFNLIYPYLESTFSGITIGLSVIVTFSDRIPTNIKKRQEIAREIANSILQNKEGVVAEGCSIRLREFKVDGAMLPLNGKDPVTLRAWIDSVTESENQHCIAIPGERGLLAIAIQSRLDDTSMESILKTIKNSAKNQLTGKRAAVFFVGLHGFNTNKLISVASQDKSSKRAPSPLSIGANNLLLGPNRDHIAGIIFSSTHTMTPQQPGRIQSTGTTYQFLNNKSKYWSEDIENALTLKTK